MVRLCQHASFYQELRRASPKKQHFFAEATSQTCLQSNFLKGEELGKKTQILLFFSLTYGSDWESHHVCECIIGAKWSPDGGCLLTASDDAR